MHPINNTMPTSQSSEQKESCQTIKRNIVLISLVTAAIAGVGLLIAGCVTGIMPLVYVAIPILSAALIAGILLGIAIYIAAKAIVGIISGIFFSCLK